MSQDLITSSEEFSDFNNDKNSNIESVPTSPETDRGSTPSSTTSTAATSIGDGKIEASKTSLNICESTPMSTSLNESDNGSLETLKGDSRADPKKDKAMKDKDATRKEKKEKKTHRTINFASGVSTTVPLTGERPKPTNHTSMDDDVLLAIFIILFDHDSKGKGMTVKQICDILVEKHPDMSKLSSKTSNLVSAKLNAYVKKVEKGDSSIHYALSRDWADSSPKRMVYVYRGILSSEYPAYVQKIIEQHREKDAAANNVLATSMGLEDNNTERGDFEVDVNNSNLVYTSKLRGLGGSDSNNADMSLGPDLSNLHSISPAGLQLNKVSPFGNGSLDFSIPQLSVPYSVAPVTASLNVTMPLISSPMDEDSTSDTMNRFAKSDFSFDKSNQYLTGIPDSEDDDDVYSTLKADFDDDDEDDTDSSFYQNHGYCRRGSDIVTERIPTGITKRTKSISFVNKRCKSNTASLSNANGNGAPGNDKIESQRLQISHSEPAKRIITAAALTPRVPRKLSISNTPNAAAAVAALRIVALGNFSATSNESVNTITSTIMSDTSVEPSISAKWLETVRSGFLNQDIESPENVTLAELDTLFT